MRTEKEIFDLILKTATDDRRIRAVYLGGSRTNPHVPKDIFQDYNIVYVVTETASFIRDETWIDIFGERLYMQLPEAMNKVCGRASDIENNYGYLVQLADGNRIDLHLQTPEFSKKDIVKDRLCHILMDKDGILPEISEATDRNHWVRRPSNEQYACCCNEFRWLLNNVAKGLWREEIPYVMDMLNCLIRPELITLLSWQVGIQTGFSCSVGKSGKYLFRFLPPKTWKKYLSTYSGAEIPAIWNSVFILCELFEQTARFVACDLEFKYNQTEADNSLSFLKNAYTLPKDAKEVL